MANTDYPRMLFHRSREPVTVQSRDEEDALGQEWSRTIWTASKAAAPEPAPKPEPEPDPPEPKEPEAEVSPEPSPRQRKPPPPAAKIARKAPAVPYPQGQTMIIIDEPLSDRPGWSRE
jgi:hypothetical protein